MDAMNALLTRRSIRVYTPKTVAQQSVEEILAAAMSAPSAGNERPWYFIILTDRTLLDEIPKFHPYSGMLKQAQVAILVCGDPGSKNTRVIGCSIAPPRPRISLSQRMPRVLVPSGAACIRPRTVSCACARCSTSLPMLCLLPWFRSDFLPRPGRAKTATMHPACAITDGRHKKTCRSQQRL